VELISASSIEEILAVDHTKYFPVLQQADGTAIAKPAPDLGRIPPETVTGHYDLPEGSYLALRIRPRDLEGVSLPGDAQVSLDLKLAEMSAVGGLAMLGHPYLPRDPVKLGSDFGLPREVAVAAASDRYARFIDAEASWTEQLAFGSGTIRFVQPPKMHTDRLIVTFRDLPLLPVTIDWPGGQTEMKPGLLIAALFVYRSVPGVRHRPVAGAGLAAAHVSEVPPAEQGPGGWKAFHLGADEIAPLNDEPGGQDYYRMRSVAAPVAGPRVIGGEPEHWNSPPLKTDATIDLHVSQSEEHDRTLAGVTLVFGRQPAGAGPKPKLKAEVWAVDPAPDQPRIAQLNTPGSARARILLATEVITRGAPTALLRFRRPAAANTLVVRLTNLSANGSLFALERLTLMCSSGPALSARPVYSQRVETMHYRITGPGLADDYGRIGPHSATLTVEYEDGRGGTAKVFRAESLLDLVQGGAQLFANSRQAHDTRTVQKERSVVLHSDETRETGTGREAWRASKMGDKVKWPTRDRPQPPGFKDSPPDPFQSYGSSETRTQTELVGHETAGRELAAVGGILNMIGLPAERMGFRQAYDASGTNLIDNLPPRLLEEDGGHAVSWNDAWGGMAGLDYIGTVKTFSLPAYYYHIDDVSDAISGIGAIVGLPGGIQAALEDPIAASGQLAGELQPVLEYMAGAVGATLGSLSFSLGGQMVAGGSVSVSLGGFMPSLSSSSAEGMTGSVAKTANRSVHSHSQSLDTGFDHTTSRTRVTSADTTRRVEIERDEDQTRQARRRGAEVHWQGKRSDIVTGSLSLGIGLPAVADEVYDTLDRLLRVRIDLDPEDDIEIDVWFDISETLVEEEI
jgi:hypothetical protein